MKRSDDLWVKFLREKYKCGNDVIPTMTSKKMASQAWKGIQQNWDATMKGVEWKLGNGVKILFWMDFWLPNHALDTVPNSLLNDKVADYISDAGAWEWHKFIRFFPSSVINAVELAFPAVRQELTPRK